MLIFRYQLTVIRGDLPIAVEYGFLSAYQKKIDMSSKNGDIRGQLHNFALALAGLSETKKGGAIGVSLTPTDDDPRLTTQASFSLPA